MKLWVHQTRGLTDIHAALCLFMRVLYTAPTGAGKTILFCYMALSAAAKGKRVAILVHRWELVRQTCLKLGAPHGIICNGYTPRYQEAIQVCSVQTLVNRLDKVPPFDLIIVDECHHTMAKTYLDILAASPGARIVGVTATPCRLDGKPLGQMYDSLVPGPTPRWLIDHGYLAQPVVYAPDQIDVTGVPKDRGDFTRNKLATTVDKPTITGCAIEHYRKLAQGLPAIAFCVSVEHAYHVAEQFRQSGYRAVAIEGKSGGAVRDDAIKALGEGKLDVLTSCDIISEGVDVPVVACGIMLRPTASLSLAIQQMGRILRAAPGKREAIILDHAGNCLRHRILPDSTIRWSLDAGAEKPDTESDDAGDSIRQCPKCYMVHKPAPFCPVCKYEYPKKVREVAQRNGSLQRITPEQLAARELPMNQALARARTDEEVYALARERGYKPGWAWNVIESRRRARKPRRRPEQQQIEGIA